MPRLLRLMLDFPPSGRAADASPFPRAAHSPGGLCAASRAKDPARLSPPKVRACPLPQALTCPGGSLQLCHGPDQERPKRNYSRPPQGVCHVQQGKGEAMHVAIYRHLFTCSIQVTICLLTVYKYSLHLFTHSIQATHVTIYSTNLCLLTVTAFTLRTSICLLITHNMYELYRLSYVYVLGIILVTCLYVLAYSDHNMTARGCHVIVWYSIPRFGTILMFTSTKFWLKVKNSKSHR